MAAESEEPQQQKEKTKAKKRYLRRKRERRKVKSRLASATAPASQDVEMQEEQHDFEGEDDVEMEVTEKPPAAKKEKRPKKRRRVDKEPEDVEMGEVQEPKELEEVTLQDDQKGEGMQDTPDIPLPIFPPPAHPNAPSKTDLALQGLDRGLLDAEIVDPRKILPIPQGEEDGGTGLSERMRRRLKDLGITELFAVQTSLLPFLLPNDTLKRALYRPYDPPPDACVSAPTGSGKTLAYVLPIVEILSTRIVTRLRALIVLPTRDLVAQVRETFEAIGKGRGLKIGTATGQQSFAHEQAQLVADRTSVLEGGSSKVDILICTPGRLIDHLNGTPNFSLQHLRFLVIDEADRLLAQSFQDWLTQVLGAIRPSARPAQVNTSDSKETPISLPVHDAVAPAFTKEHYFANIPALVAERKEPSCQKLLFSATLTRDFGKIAALELRNPKYFVIQDPKQDVTVPGILDVVMEKFSVPSTLTEHMIVCESSQKPLMLFHLVHNHSVSNALVFTKSAESTSRLVRLFEFFERSRASRVADGTTQVTAIRSYSSDLPSSERKAILDKFKAQEIQILVCSDLISRGIDISHVSHVVSYDAPVDFRKYVHRVGRTARAGRTGDAWTLVEEQEARYFKNMLKEADHLENVKRMRVNSKDVGSLVPDYQVALEQLREAYTK